MGVDGTYQITAKTPVGEHQGTLILTTEGASLSGTMRTPFGLSEFSGGKVNGNEFQFTARIKTPMAELPLECSGVVDGDKITGSAKPAFFTPAAGTFAGSRV